MRDDKNFEIRKTFNLFSVIKNAGYTRKIRFWCQWNASHRSKLLIWLKKYFWLNHLLSNISIWSTKIWCKISFCQFHFFTTIFEEAVVSFKVLFWSSTLTIKTKNIQLIFKSLAGQSHVPDSLHRKIILTVNVECENCYSHIILSSYRSHPLYLQQNLLSRRTFSLIKNWLWTEMKTDGVRCQITLLSPITIISENSYENSSSITFHAIVIEWILYANYICLQNKQSWRKDVIEHRVYNFH